MTSGARSGMPAAVLVAAALLATSCAGTAQIRSGPAAPVSSAAAAVPRAVAAQDPALPATASGAAPAPASVPVRTPCTHNRLSRYVFVSVRKQHMWMCARHRVAYSTPITSGIVGEYTSTPTGTFEIQGRVRDTSLTLIDGTTYPVKYWIPFEGPLFGFHDAPWQTFPYGSRKYRTQGSHGCIHMPLAAIRFLYRWADIGTTVRITH